MDAIAHPLNWFAGWTLLLLGFLTGAIIGMRFHDESFLGGYASFRRRIVRLGHIALAALGILNVVFSLSPVPSQDETLGRWASICFVAGGVAMPAVCFLTGWRPDARRWFFIPVLLLMSAVVLTLIGGIL